MLLMNNTDLKKKYEPTYMHRMEDPISMDYI